MCKGGQHVGGIPPTSSDQAVETGAYLATSDDLPGLVAQGRTVAETVEISQAVARKPIESCREHGDPLPKGGLRPVDKAGVELTIPVGACWAVGRFLSAGDAQIASAGIYIRSAGTRKSRNLVEPRYPASNDDSKSPGRFAGGNTCSDSATSRHQRGKISCSVGFRAQISRRGFSLNVLVMWRLGQSNQGTAYLSKGMHDRPIADLQPRAPQEQRQDGPCRGLRSACRTCRQTTRTGPGRLRSGQNGLENRREVGRR